MFILIFIFTNNLHSKQITLDELKNKLKTVYCYYEFDYNHNYKDYDIKKLTFGIKTKNKQALFIGIMGFLFVRYNFIQIIIGTHT